MKTNSKTFIGILGVIVVILGVVWLANQPNKPLGPGPLDSFATCLKDKGVLFYGAFWCSHCKAQKALFGNSVSKLPYVECSTPDGGSQLQVCTDKNVTSYPTWVFPNGDRLTGEISLADLSQKSSCELPPKQ